MDRHDWLSGQAPFSAMPDDQLRNMACETREYHGATVPGLNAEAAKAELARRALSPKDPLPQEQGD